MSLDHSRASPLPIVGWVEYVSLPSWGVARLRAKMDTGAKTSALHVENIVELGHGRVRFDVVLNRRNRRLTHVEARIRRRSRVRSSNGEYSTRIFVSTLVKLGKIVRDVEFSLVDRGRMIHRVLLGRAALEGVLVDVKHQFQCEKKKVKKTKKKRKKATRRRE